MAQVEAMLDACAERAASLVKKYRDDVERVAEALVEQRYLDGAEVDDRAGAILRDQAASKDLGA